MLIDGGVGVCVAVGVAVAVAAELDAMSFVPTDLDRQGSQNSIAAIIRDSEVDRVIPRRRKNFRRVWAIEKVPSSKVH
jgi:hypothetical protein